MITDDELIRLLELADPALVDDPAPVLDPAEYRGALHTRTTVTLIDHEPAPTQPTSGGRWPILIAAAAVMLVVGVLVVRGGDDSEIEVPAAPPSTVPSTTTAETSSTELIVRPLDPPIECELELCPSLAVSPDGTLVAYDQTAQTLTWYDAEPHVVHVTADLDAEQVQLEAIGPNDNAYLLAGSPDTESWELVMISPSGEEVRRTPSSSSDVEPSESGPRERYCWSGCNPTTRLLMSWDDGSRTSPYPRVTSTNGAITADLGAGRRPTIAWPHTLSSRSQVAHRWDDGAVLSLVPEAADAPSELVELRRGGSVQRFSLGHETVHVLLPDGSAVVWRDGQLVRLSPPQPAAPPELWSPELTVQASELPIACKRGPARPYCPQVAVSPDGTLVVYDQAAATLTWYEDQPRVVPLRSDGAYGMLVAIGPHDIAYFMDPLNDFAAVAPSGAEITRIDWTSDSAVYPTATGLVPIAIGWPSPDTLPTMPWVDLDGNPITDTRLYPTARPTDAGVEVRLGEQEWLVAGGLGNRPELFDFLDLRPRSDGGVVMVVPYEFGGITLLELSPDGTIERYFVGSGSLSLLIPTVLPDGSLIIEHDLQIVRLTPPAA